MKQVRPVEKIMEMYAELKGLDNFAVRSIDNNYYMYDKGTVLKVSKEQAKTTYKEILLEEEEEDEWCLFEFENYFEGEYEPLVIEIDDDDEE